MALDRAPGGDQDAPSSATGVPTETSIALTHSNTMVEEEAAMGRLLRDRARPPAVAGPPRRIGAGHLPARRALPPRRGRGRRPREPQQRHQQRDRADAAAPPRVNDTSSLTGRQVGRNRISVTEGGRAGTDKAPLLAGQRCQRRTVRKGSSRDGRLRGCGAVGDRHVPGDGPRPARELCPPSLTPSPPTTGDGHRTAVASAGDPTPPTRLIGFGTSVQR